MNEDVRRDGVTPLGFPVYAGRDGAVSWLGVLGWLDPDGREVKTKKIVASDMDRTGLMRRLDVVMQRDNCFVPAGDVDW